MPEASRLEELIAAALCILCEILTVIQSMSHSFGVLVGHGIQAWISAGADMSAAPSFASTPMSSAAHHAAAEHDHYFPTVSSTQSAEIHADSQHYSSRPEQYDDDGILNDSEPPSRQVALRLSKERHII